ncbi:MAG TPA: PQQ-binding-like beta-propeller repeat protein [Bryobacteraceae bacterium]|jgi:outer membrane protein assembly factor BamB|nr:PQQ-binding-like beta-propeller repeat protein [Bryobacteraceae bacterium]
MRSRRFRIWMWILIFVLPPVGFILMLMRTDWSILRRVGATFLIAIIGVAELFVAVAGLRLHQRLGLDPSGDFSQFFYVRESRAEHAARLERDREKQRVSTPPIVIADEPLAVSTAVAPRKTAALPTPAPAKPRYSYWTDFRGPHRAGEYTQGEILTTWPATGLERLWKQPIGGGYASFTIGDGRAYTIEQRRDKEAITAYDPETGRELWAFSYPAQFEEFMGGPGPRATPVFHEGLVYSLGALGDFYCLDARNGKPKWSKNILADNGAKNIQWAMSGAPLIVGDLVIVTPGGPGAAPTGKSIVAYNRITGEPAWRSLGDRAGYTSPILAELAGRKQIIWISAERAVGITLDDGKLLWEYPFPSMNDMNCSQPVLVDATHVLLSSEMGPGAALLEIQKHGDGQTAREVWKNNRFKNKFNSSVLRQGYAYGFDSSILACINVMTGELKWKGGRYGFGQLLLAGDSLVVLTERGELVLVRATPDSFQEVAKFQAIEGKTWNIPAIDNGLLLVRNAAEMACFRLGKSSL